MTLDSRKNLLQEMANHLGFPVLAYVTGERQGLQTQIGSDQVALFPRHLMAIGDHEKIGILLHTRGGDTNVPWAIVNMMREHCGSLTALIPSVALSSGTLLSLGADEIIMTRYASISPIDPNVANEFNPANPSNPALKIQIAVEDLLAYLELASENVEREAYDQAFQQLTQTLHPLALGNAKRSINMIRMLAKKLISLHPPERTVEELLALVTTLTTEFYSHQHLIGRREAREIGLPIVDADSETERLLLSYWEELKIDLELENPFNPANLLRIASGLAAPAVAPAGGAAVAIPPQVAVQVVAERGYVETISTCDAFVSRGEVGQQTVMTPMGQQQGVAFQVHTELWERLA
jgi:hypothetical protein